jgi:hypothetical protein
MVRETPIGPTLFETRPGLHANVPTSTPEHEVIVKGPGPNRPGSVGALLQGEESKNHVAWTAASPPLRAKKACKVKAKDPP